MVKGVGSGRDVVLWVIVKSGVWLSCICDVIFMLYNGCWFFKKRCL